MEKLGTPFSVVYSSFLSKITDDMYFEFGFTELDTFRLLEELLVNAIHKFEFPRVNLDDYEVFYIDDEDTYCGVESDYCEVRALICAEGCFSSALTHEEVNILATYMAVEWIGQQLASIENTRMKYTGSDFKMSSQANHMHKLKDLKKEYEREGFHLQRLYGRRQKGDTGLNHSTMWKLRAPISQKEDPYADLF